MGTACSDDAARQDLHDANGYEAHGTSGDHIDKAVSSTTPPVAASLVTCSSSPISCAGSKEALPFTATLGEDDPDLIKDEACTNSKTMTAAEAETATLQRVEKHKAFQERQAEMDRILEEATKRREKEASSPTPFGQWALSAFFMERELPGAHSEVADAEILDTIHSFLSSLSDDALDWRVRKLGMQFCSLHRSSMGERVCMPDHSQVRESLGQVPVGAFWATWVHAQNAVLFLERTSHESGIISVWPCQPPVQDILRVVPGFVSVPEVSTEVPWASVTLNAFASRVAELMANSSLSPNSADYVSPTLVMDFLLPALGGDVVDLTANFRCIGKKLRDESRMREGKIPWRRPVSWLALKALLHLSCVRTHKADGHTAYKLLMLRLLSEALRHTEQGLRDDSARVEAARKIARRLRKLQLRGISGDATSVALSAVQDAMRPVERRWHQECEHDIPANLVSGNLKFDSDVVHRLRNSRPILDELLAKKEVAKRIAPKKPLCTPRVDSASAKPFSDNLERLRDPRCADHDDATTALFDAESSVMKLWEQWEKSKKTDVIVDELPSVVAFLNMYLSIAGKLYRNDVEGRSRMVLVVVVVAMLVDRQACETHRILKEHHTGVDESMLAYLFLSSAREKKLLHSVETYLTGRNSRAGANNTSIVHSDVHDQAFNVRFAQNSKTMREAVEDIQRECNKLKQTKEFEVAKGMREYKELHEQSDKLKCVCELARQIHCAKHHALMKARNYGMEFYSSILPADEKQQLAVVFDLQIPPILSCLRDIMHIVLRFCAEEANEDTKARGNWRSEKRLQRWCHQLPQKPRIQLAYSRHAAAPDSKHITAHATFVVDSDLDVVLADCDAMRLVNPAPTWSISEFLKLETRDPRYQSLQFGISSWTHNENMVIAQKCNAHADLSLREFESFGCLRAGIRLQLPRLARALAQQALSFDRHGVVDLVAASLMQAGPSGQVGTRDAGAWRRQAHELLGQQYFCDDLCAHASALLQQQALNWTRHLLLLNIVNIGRCIAHHAPNSTKATQLLLDCREVACKWISQVRAAMTRANEKSFQKLRLKLVDIAATANLTYDANFSALVGNKQEAATFLWLRAVLSDNMVLGNIKLAKVEPFRLNLLRKGFRIALEMEEKLHGILGRTESLVEFVSHHWGDASNGKCGKWQQHTGHAKRWYETTFTTASGKSTLQVDVLRGVFLVNGSPVGQLPVSITSHKDYIRLFGDSVFEVQPAVGGGWRTLANAEGVSFSFFHSQQSEGSPVIIEERRLKNGIHTRAQLVPHYHFRGDLPDALVDEYSHWLVRAGQSPRVFFRPPRYDHIDFKRGCSFEGAAYVLDTNTSYVHDTVLDRLLVDVLSPTFAELYDNIFSRLVPRGRMHAFHSGHGSVVVLPQLHGIQFHIEGDRIRSHEFGGFVVSNQNIGTLIGLRNGLLLEDPIGERTVLMPHAAAFRTSRKQNVVIHIDKLRHPPLFVYTVREDLRELHGQKDRLAWLYLAKLHALSANPLPDPFLGRTGTAQALHLLGSGRCRGNLGGSGGWSSLLADLTLLEIAKLSPSRQPVKKGKSKNSIAIKDDLPSHPLPALCAHDGFGWMVARMRDESRQAAKFAGGEMAVGSPPPPARPPNSSITETDVLDSFVGQSSRRAYLQSRELYAADARLCEEDESEIMGPLKACLSLQPLLIKHESLLSWTDLRLIAEPMQKKRPINSNADLIAMLLGSNMLKLKGLTRASWHLKTLADWLGMCVGQAAVFNLKNDNLEGFWLAHYWLDLYDLARGCVGTDKEEQLFQLRLCFSFLAQRDPLATDYLAQLGTIALNADKFRHLDPPEYMAYHLPGQADFVEKVVAAEIDKCKVPYIEAAVGVSKAAAVEALMDDMGEWRKSDEQVAIDRRKMMEASTTDEKRNAHNLEFNRSKTALIAIARKAFASEKTVVDKMCDLPNLARAGELSTNIQSHFRRWRENKELHVFLSKVVEQVKNIKSLESGSWVDRSWISKLPDEVNIRPNMFRLASPQPVPVDLSPADHATWTGRSSARWNFLEDEPTSPSSPTSGKNTDLPISAGREATKLYHHLLSPLREGWSLAQSRVKPLKPNVLNNPGLVAKVRNYLETARADVERLSDQIRRASEPLDDAGKALEACGLWPAAVPTVLLEAVLPHVECSETWRVGIGAYALALRHQQRAHRCWRLLRRKDAPRAEQELKNPGCDGWAPREHPEWLLLELDNDFCIRPQQAAVAKQIMSDEHGNRLLQLIMGAGKTAVIIPMVLASLADGQRCARVTVIGPMYATNAADWQLKLGGLLRRRIYPLICRRELKLERFSNEILDQLNSICSGRHVIVTVPEHRLSLENKFLELAAAGDQEGSIALQKVLNFLACYGRDVLDESDEILHPKFQLIYTLGESVELDGAAVRWTIAAAVLHSAARHAEGLRAEFGNDAVELKDTGETGSTFPAVRLLEKARCGAYARLCELIVDDFLTGMHPAAPVFLQPHEVPLWRAAVLDKGSTDTWNTFSPGLRRLALLLRGLLCHEILFGALHKRWRVEYGGHLTGRTRMAVPYRAKDVASDRTEFGHPDTALLLTTLHYYNSGLSREQLEEVFRRLSRKGVAQAQSTYAFWAQGAPSMTVRSWTGVNLDDAEQFDSLLYPVLYRHMHVVDFWLDQVAFPVEAKQYCHKMVSTAWDLCGSDSSCITTGFSGTDDAQLLLPLTIRQSNMDELKETNGVLLHNLLRKENDEYTALPAGASGQQLLEHVSADARLDVLLDAGALVLELSNRQVAQAWLEQRKDRAAAVYFEGDRIDVVDRFGLSMPLAVSPFERSMADCLLYLDDEHTRGSDFTLPQGRRAAVTLGKGMQKDKMTQAVMRMRQLGNGHTVCFYASFEANLQIEHWRLGGSTFKGDAALQTGDLVHLPAILSWCLSNTVTSSCEKLMYMVAQGASQLRKRHARESNQGNLIQMGKKSAEPELLTLQDLYGYASGTASMPDIAQRLLCNTTDHLDGTATEATVTMAARIISHVKGLVSDVHRSTTLFDEEHERELEEELEEEYEAIERPAAAAPIVPELSAGLIEFARTGRPPEVPFRTLDEALVETSFANLLDGQWDELIQVTPDFVNTVQGDGLKDSFLRPVMWMLGAQGCHLLLLISNFEAEELAAQFLNRKGKIQLNLVTPEVRLNQPEALPSIAENLELPIAARVFAGQVHGNDSFMDNMRSFLGLCPMQLNSSEWQRLFDQSAFEKDGFVLSEFRSEVTERLGVHIHSPFSKSPLRLLERLYIARHLSEDLEASPVGKLLGSTDICREGERPNARLSVRPQRVSLLEAKERKAKAEAEAKRKKTEAEAKKAAEQKAKQASNAAAKKMSRVQKADPKNRDIESLLKAKGMSVEGLKNFLNTAIG